MNDDEIKNVHAYLMEEWKINQKLGPVGPQGPIGPSGRVGPVGKHGRSGENASYYAQYFQYSKTEWDIDFKPNFWIDGHDILNNTPFKVLNMHDHKYDATVPSSSTSPTKGTDPVTGRYTLSLNGSQYLTCPMNWNTGGGSIDNLQVYIVFKYTKIYAKNVRECIFGNDNGGWDRVVGLYNNKLIVGGTTGTHGYTLFSNFPIDADPRELNKFCILSVHWNNKGENCGADRSCIWCNGKHVGDHFTAADVTGDSSFSLGSSSTTVKINNPMTGEIGRFLVCGNRARPTSETEIKRVHKYLMDEWKINEKPVFDICKWMPHFVLKQLREGEEQCCFVINDPNKDLKKDHSGKKYMTWLSRNKNKKNAESDKPSTSCKLIKRGHWGLNFNNSLYHVDEVELSYADCVFACVTFQLDGDLEQFIFNDFVNDQDEIIRGISATQNAIIIWGVDDVSASYKISIPYHNDKATWTTVFVEWLSEDYNRQGRYIINNKENGIFICNKIPVFTSARVYLGGKMDGTKSLRGSICAFESYKSVKNVPDSIKTLIIENQIIK